jgi:hypothetical protein
MQATIADVIRAVMRSMRSSLDDDDRAGLQMKLDNHSQKLPNSGAEVSTDRCIAHSGLHLFSCCLSVTCS